MNKKLPLIGVWSAWENWRRYYDPYYRKSYRARRRELRVGKVLVCVFCETELYPRTPFFFYMPGHRIKGLIRHATEQEAIDVLTQELQHHDT